MKKKQFPPPPIPQNTPTPVLSPNTPPTTKNYKWWILGIILIITALCFKSILNNQFTNWDDPFYVLESRVITSLGNISDMFNPQKRHLSLNYHPLTILSLAINYAMAGGVSPKVYFATNLFLHLANVFLTFLLVYKLTHKKMIAASFAALWFGIHPMHVESVAWISARKDLLYTLFFNISLIFYIQYIKNQNIKTYILTFLFFIFSCFSKAMAVPLPLILILIDYYYGNKNLKNVQIWVQKIPFLIISLLVGLWALHIQQEGEAVADFAVLTPIHRIIYASFGYVMYWIKAIFPFNLSAFYPYPYLKTLNEMPFFYYLFPLFAIVITFLPAYFFYKKKQIPALKTWIFGTAFFILTIAMVLQMVSVGAAVMADRYTYLSYTGLFVIAGVALQYFYNNLKSKEILIIFALIYSTVLAFLCYQRTQIWHNTETLWTDVIEKYPKQVETAYKNRGNFYAQNNLLDKAYADYMVLTQEMNTKDGGVYSNLGNLEALKQAFDKSLVAYSKAVELDSTNYEAYLNQGITYSKMQQPEKSVALFEKAYRLQPNNPKVCYTLACAYSLQKMNDQALPKLDEYLDKYGENAEIYFYKALTYYNMQQIDLCIGAYQKAITLRPNYAEVYYNLAQLFLFNKNDKTQAQFYAQKAQELGYQIPADLLQKLK